MKALLLLFSVLLILLLVGLWVGNGGYPDRWRIEQEISAQQKANERQKEKNRKIQAELDDLTSGNDAIEERARSELGMTKKGETFYEVILQPEPDKDQTRSLESKDKKSKIKGDKDSDKGSDKTAHGDTRVIKLLSTPDQSNKQKSSDKND